MRCSCVTLEKSCVRTVSPLVPHSLGSCGYAQPLALHPCLSYFAAVLVAGRGLCWSWPDLTGWLPGLTSGLPHPYGLARWSGLLADPAYCHWSDPSLFHAQHPAAPCPLLMRALPVAAMLSSSALRLPSLWRSAHSCGSLKELNYDCAGFLLMLCLLTSFWLDAESLSGLLQLWVVLFPNCFQEQEDTVNVSSDFTSSYTGIKTRPWILDKAHPIPVS